MLKKIPVIAGGLIGIFIVISIIAVATNPEAKKSFEKGQNQAKQIVEEKKSTPTPTAETLYKEAVLSGKDESGKIVVQDIAIWMKPGSGADNVWAGTVPDNTKVEVLDRKVADEFVFYLIRSSVGKVDVLPTDLGSREKAKEKLPQSEWTVDADPSFPVKGWVIESFITNLK